MLDSGEPTGQLPRNRRRPEIEAFQHQRDHIALGIQRSFDLPAQPIIRIVATLQRRRSQQDNEMCPGPYVADYHALKIAAGKTREIGKTRHNRAASDSEKWRAPREYWYGDS